MQVFDLSNQHQPKKIQPKERWRKPHHKLNPWKWWKPTKQQEMKETTIDNHNMKETTIKSLESWATRLTNFHNFHCQAAGCSAIQCQSPRFHLKQTQGDINYGMETNLNQRNVWGSMRIKREQRSLAHRIRVSYISLLLLLHLLWYMYEDEWTSMKIIVMGYPP